jgi:hypothetical protein
VGTAKPVVVATVTPVRTGRSKRRLADKDDEEETAAEPNVEDNDEEEEKEEAEIDEPNGEVKSEVLGEDGDADDEIVDAETVKVEEEVKGEPTQGSSEATKIAVVVTPIAENQQYLDEMKCWRCICLNLEDWTAVFDKYKASKKKPDQELAELLDEQYLPEMPALFAKAVIIIFF